MYLEKVALPAAALQVPVGDGAVERRRVHHVVPHAQVDDAPRVVRQAAEYLLRRDVRQLHALVARPGGEVRGASDHHYTQEQDLVQVAGTLALEGASAGGDVHDFAVRKAEEEAGPLADVGTQRGDAGLERRTRRRQRLNAHLRLHHLRRVERKRKVVFVEEHVCVAVAELLRHVVQRRQRLHAAPFLLAAVLLQLRQQHGRLLPLQREPLQLQLNAAALLAFLLDVRVALVGALLRVRVAAYALQPGQETLLELRHLVLDVDHKHPERRHQLLCETRAFYGAQACVAEGVVTCGDGHRAVLRARLAPPPPLTLGPTPAGNLTASCGCTLVQ
eukprot:Rhum_TRINITY_DN8944_c0_g1::Rhum_TRINITY_DN8944_c0_g1_i1::g.30484::m.30484